MKKLIKSIKRNNGLYRFLSRIKSLVTRPSQRIMAAFGIFPLPTTVCIDPLNSCNLRCPLCATGTAKSNYPKVAMSFDTFEKIINKIPSLRKIILYNWGEPFLNSDIFKMVKYAKNKNIEVQIHTNFSLKRDGQFFINIVESGLDELTLSLDGASQESYSKYRQGGDFNLVISNIKKLIREKNRLKLDNPKITWKFIVNKHNENEIDKAKRVANSLGIQFTLEKIGLGDDLPDLKLHDDIEEIKRCWLPKNKEFILDAYKGKYKFPIFEGECNQLFSYMIVNPDGEVFPCCWATDKRNSFGNLLEKSLKDIWNNDKYKYSRWLFRYNLFRPKKVRTICSTCNNYKKRIM